MELNQRTMNEFAVRDAPFEVLMEYFWNKLNRKVDAIELSSGTTDTLREGQVL